MDRINSRGRRPRRAVVITAMSLSALAAMAPSTSVAAAPPGAILSLQGATLISAVIPASVDSTYRSLLPKGIAPAARPRNRLDPNRPSVKLTGLDITSGGLSTYESYAMLRSRYCGQKGWYNRADGVILQLVKDLGDQLGISKYMLDPKSSLGQDAAHPDVWRSRAKFDGKPFVTLTWRNDPLRLVQLLRQQPWQRGWLRGSGAPFRAPIWDAFPVSGQDGTLNWIDASSPDSVDPPQWKNRVGVVTVQVRQGVDPSRTYGDWMSLVPKTVEVPGVLQSFDKGTSYVARRQAALGAC
jgi:hypothetical protein